MTKKLREAWGEASQIWGNSSFANRGGREKMESLLKFEEDVLHALKEKRVSMLECIAPGSGETGFVRV
jgi:hypothetical protein